jgi:type I restriction enzyme S subunit
MVATKEEWERVPINSVYHALYDGPHATPKPSTEGPVFLGIKNITEDGRLDLSDVRHISEEDFSTWTRRVLPQAGDIVFTYEATLNRYAMIPEGFRGCLGRRLALIRPNPDKICPRFLYYSFFGEDWRRTIARNTLSGSTVDRIPLTTFPTFKISLPPNSTQEKIVDILSAYDDLIENNTRRIAILEEMARSLYREWFGNFRYPGHEQVAMVDSVLGPVPAGWEVTKLGAVAELVYGRALRADDRIDGVVPVYGSSGVVGYHNSQLVEGPGIIVGRKGNVGTIFWSDGGFFPIDTVFYVRTSLPLRYLYYNLLLDQQFQSSDVAVPGLNRSQAYLNPLLVPTHEVISAFEELVAAFLDQRRILEAQSANLRSTRDLLLPKLISGEIDLSAAHLTDVDIVELVEAR